jgi:hypothetical protein
VRADRADRGTDRFTANENAVAARDHAAHGLAGFRIISKRIVVDALLDLEGSDWFGGIGGLVNVSRHATMYSGNGLGASILGKCEIVGGRIALGYGCLCRRLVRHSASESTAGQHPPGPKSDMELTLSQSGALYFASHGTAKRRSALFRRFAAASRIQPPDIHRRTFAVAHASRRFHSDNGR